MTAAVRAELRKVFTTRLWWGMAIAVVATSAAFSALFGFLYTSSGLPRGPEAAVLPTTDLELARSIYTGGIGIGYLLTLAIGVMTIGSEYRHQTITGTFLAMPRRGRVMLAKVVSLLVVGAFYGILSLAAAVATGSAILSARGHVPFPDPSVWRTLALALLVLGLWALIGLGAGILIPNQVAALLISIAVAWIVEPVVRTVLTVTDTAAGITPYFPSAAASATLDVRSLGFGAPLTDPLPWWAGALVLLAYAVVMAGLGTWRTLRADIS